MISIVHYHPDTGTIVGWETALVPSPRDGYAMMQIVEGEVWPPDPTTHRINPTTQKMVALSTVELAWSKAPTLLDIQSIIAAELKDSDAHVSAPDYPITAEMRTAWGAYRQALRDLSKGDPKPTPAQMLAAFPNRPDGRDATAIIPR